MPQDLSQPPHQDKPKLTYLITEPAQKADACVIWLHGLGADGHDFAPIVPELNLPAQLNIRFIFPHAHARPVSINNGYIMPAWYDIFDRSANPARDDQQSDDQQEDAAGIMASEQLIHQLIDEQIAQGIKAQRIILAGFSQGGAIALHTGLRYPEKLAGIMALSTYLPLADRLKAEKHPANADTPILMVHGTLDAVIPLQKAQNSYQLLQKQDYAVDWQTYLMDHTVSADEIITLSKWLVQQLA